MPEAGRATSGETRSATGRWADPNGNPTVKVVPAPAALSAVMVPPCSPTSSLTRASPIPLPSVDRALAFSMRWNRSNRRGISDSGMPVPVSATVITAPVAPAETRTVIEPSKVNFSALESRLSTTFSHMSRSM
jgi:hypothetical protein